MRISTQIVVYLILMNATAGVLAASGVAADLGIGAQPGGGEQVGFVNDKASPDNINPGGGAGGTLFGLFTSVGATLKQVFVMATVGGPMMLSNLGVPVWLVTFIFAPVYLIAGADLLYVYSGRDV